MKLDQKCACAAVLGFAVVAVGHHASYCPQGQLAPAFCYALPPEQVHGNHNEHRPITPSQLVASIATSTSSTVVPPGNALVR
jgi:hypothetical protein